MRGNWLPRILSGAVASLLCASAGAQTAPPIEPGLWEVHMDRVVDGRKAPDLSGRLAAMSPEQRAMMESMMKQHGVDMSGGAGEIKVCIDRDALAKGEWRGRQAQQERGCKTDYLERSTRRWRWHTVCTDPAIVADGEASFDGARRYTMKVNSTTTGADGPRKSEITMQSKWLGADCGDVKPAGSGFGPGNGSGAGRRP